jgi:outer membrane protein TolC
MASSTSLPTTTPRIASGSSLAHCTVSPCAASVACWRARSVPEAPAASSAALGAQAVWEIDLFGGIAAGQRASAQRLRGAEAGWHEARVSLAADVGTAYVNLRGCEAQMQQAQADAASREATARLTSQSAAAGFTAPADAALVRASAAQARSQVRAQQAQCDTLIKALVELTDRPEPALRQQLAAHMARLPQAAGLATLALPAQLLQQHWLYWICR